MKGEKLEEICKRIGIAAFRHGVVVLAKRRGANRANTKQLSASGVQRKNSSARFLEQQQPKPAVGLAAWAVR